MKLKFIGTGSILTSALSASVLIDDRIQIDMPNGYCKSARRLGVSITNVDLVLLTHFHGDHYFDFPFFFLEQGLRHERDKELVILGPPGLETRLKRLHDLAYGNWDKVTRRSKVRFVEYCDGTKYQFEEYEIGVYEVDHAEEEAYGFTITKNGKTIGYTGDSKLCDAVFQIAESADLVVTDASFVTARGGHMGLDSAEKIFERIKGRNKQLVGNHMTDDSRNAEISFNMYRPADGDECSI